MEKKELLKETNPPVVGQVDEFELKLELIGDIIKTARKKRSLTQEQLGELVGVKKAHISRLENSTGNVTFETVLKILNALDVKLRFKLEM